MDKIQIINITIQSAVLVLQFVVALFLAYIAYNNSRTQKDSLRLNLFEKRYAVYRSVMEYLGSIIHDGDSKIEAFNSFVLGTRDADFLFENEIGECIKVIKQKGIRLRYVNQRLSDRRLEEGSERSELAQEDGNLLLWFADQVEIAKDEFKKYLYFPIVI